MYTFTKKERLNSEKDIQRLFENGLSFFSYPFKVYYHFIKNEEDKPIAAVLFSIGKKQFKHAVDRNRIKRLCREAYRLNKALLVDSLEKKQCKIEVAFVYAGKTIPDYHELETKMIKALNHLAELQIPKD